MKVPLILIIDNNIDINIFKTLSILKAIFVMALKYRLYDFSNYPTSDKLLFDDFIICIE